MPDGLRPDSSAHYLTDMTLADVVLIGELILRDATRQVLTSNLAYLLGCKNDAS